MPKTRSSIKHAKHNDAFKAQYERIARDIAFEAGVSIDIEGLNVFVLDQGDRQVLCTADDLHRLWRQVLASLCERYPHLARQN